ncbi:hypothetical protein [Bradyrhizobium guangdongense]
MSPHEPQELTVSIAEQRLTNELQALGFIARTDQGKRQLKMVKNLNSQTEIFIYPGVRRRGSDVLIDPVMGVENVSLRERLLALDQRWEGSTRVCHVYLGLKASWGRFYIRTDTDLNDAASKVVKAIVEIGVPLLSAYDTLDKVRKLFQDELEGRKVDVAVLFAEEKLAVIGVH